MEDYLVAITGRAVVVINAFALVIIALGTLESFAFCIRMLVSHPSGHEIRRAWMRYARWLVAGLTYQLSADILETAITPSWDQIGRLGAIAVIRTFLNYFLERDVAEVRARDETLGKEAPQA
jgi:uncharacterized membrane protein